MWFGLVSLGPAHSLPRNVRHVAADSHACSGVAGRLILERVDRVFGIMKSLRRLCHYGRGTPLGKQQQWSPLKQLKRPVYWGACWIHWLKAKQHDTHKSSHSVLHTQLNIVSDGRIDACLFFFLWSQANLLRRQHCVWLSTRHQISLWGWEDNQFWSGSVDWSPKN